MNMPTVRTASGSLFAIESHYRARYYDPPAGRFLSEDPVGFDAGANFYRYVRNNPIIFVDPAGLQGSYDPPDRHKNTIVCDGHGSIDFATLSWPTSRI